MDISSRLNSLLKQKGWSQIMLAKHIGVSQAYVSQLCNGIRTPSPDVLRSIGDALSIPVSYLLGESTECYLTQSEKELLDKFRNLQVFEQSIVFRMIGALVPDNTQKDRVKKVTRMPVFNDPAAAGPPLYAESSFEYVEFNSEVIPEGAEFGVRISGKSMEPTISDGQVVFVERRSELSDGEIGIFILDGGDAVCKRYHADKFGVELRSDNPEYKGFKNYDLLNSRLVGRVLLP